MSPETRRQTNFRTRLEYCENEGSRQTEAMCFYYRAGVLEAEIRSPLARGHTFSSDRTSAIHRTFSIDRSS